MLRPWRSVTTSFSDRAIVTANRAAIGAGHGPCGPDPPTVSIDRVWPQAGNNRAAIFGTDAPAFKPGRAGPTMADTERVTRRGRARGRGKPTHSGPGPSPMALRPQAALWLRAHSSAACTLAVMWAAERRIARRWHSGHGPRRVCLGQDLSAGCANRGGVIGVGS